MTRPRSHYRGRFAPTPSGPLHAGSLVAALASWLDARVHGGQWLVRIEDTDTPRCVPGADRLILQQLDALGLRPDEPVTWQSRRSAFYEQALNRLQSLGQAYACTCSRKAIERALAAQGIPKERHAISVYPRTCRPHSAPSSLLGVATAAPHTVPQTAPQTVPPTAQAVAWRIALPDALTLTWNDRRLGPQRQDLVHEVGDFVIRRADGLWAYQMAVVVDDAQQGITDVVRGEDLTDNTPRQMHLQSLLGATTPDYLHTPLVLADDGQKLSKQTGAAASHRKYFSINGSNESSCRQAFCNPARPASTMKLRGVCTGAPGLAT